MKAKEFILIPENAEKGIPEIMELYAKHRHPILKRQIKEMKESRLDYTKWLIEELDNRMIDKVTDDDAESFIDDYDKLKP